MNKPHSCFVIRLEFFLERFASALSKRGFSNNPDGVSCASSPESQRDSIIQPRVGAERLPWVRIQKNINHNVVASCPPRWDATPSELISFCVPLPSVAPTASRQRWAE